jgi:restriction system protein
MAIPQYEYVRYALLKYASDGKEHNVKETTQALADYFGLTDEELQELLKNGKNYKFRYMVAWAKTYLTKAKLLESTGRGTYQITQRGYDYLKTITDNIITKTALMQFPEFAGFATSNEQDEPDNFSPINNGEIYLDDTPEEIFARTYTQLYKSLKDELLEAVLSVTPAFFERLVVDLLLAMGYGSSLDSGERIGQSGDGGVDGVIREDKLGLDMIYIQAKRYTRDNGVGRPAVQAFVGSLMGMGATKGVFITTSYFSEQAIQYAKAVPNVKVILIDGQQLATLMIEHNVGVSVQKTYEIKQIDENYFPDA